MTKRRPSRPFQIHSQTTLVRFTQARLRRTLRHLDQHSPWLLPDGELSIALFDDANLAALHQQFLDDPTPTDVITFPGDPLLDFAGEICISAERALIEATQRSIPLQQELTLYLVHGWLHLAGLNDLSCAQQQEMRAAEKVLLDSICQADVWPDFTIQS